MRKAYSTPGFRFFNWGMSGMGTTIFSLGPAGGVSSLPSATTLTFSVRVQVMSYEESYVKKFLLKMEILPSSVKDVEIF